MFRQKKKVKTRQRLMIPFPLPPVKPWGLCMGLSMGGSFGLYLAQARRELQAHTRRPMIPFPFPPVKPWGLCMGLSMGGSFGLYLAQARHKLQTHTTTSHDPVPVPPAQVLGFVYGFVYEWKLRLALGSCSAQLDLISDQTTTSFTIRSNFSFHL
jgi:pimeloyl-ACP methyl ester carboxylesterase